MILPDWRIEEYASRFGMIRPFLKERLSSYGYDMTLSGRFLIPTRPRKELVIDPKSIALEDFEQYDGESIVIPPNSFILGKSIEYFKIPRDVLAVCMGRSTHARCGIISHVTPLEPEWEGVVTIGISNANNLPAKVYANEGFTQIIFLKASEICKRSYSDKNGVYQKQMDISLSNMKTGQAF